MGGRSQARLRISRNGSVVLAHVARAASRCARINVHIPKLGYVAIGETLAEGEQFDTLKVRLDGERARLADLALLANYQLGELGEPVTEIAAEYVVPVRWIVAHPKAQAYWEKGTFANQKVPASCVRSSRSTGWP